MKIHFALLLLPLSVFGQAKSLPLDSEKGLTLHNVAVTPVTLKGKKTLKAAAPMAAPDQGAGRLDHLAIATGVEFSNGTIEVDLAGEPGAGVGGGARGFVGVAWRVQADKKTYDCFYLRPTNGRAEDQERRNHTAQYISHPVHTWSKLRQETPSRYESYVDIQPSEWIHVKIDVDGVKARLFVSGAEQPALIVNDVKSGAAETGGVALWFEGSTVAHFANLKVTPR